MELQNQLQGDWSPYICNQPPEEFDTRPNHHHLCNELTNNSVQLKRNSDPYCSIWKDTEQTEVKNCNNRSFAMDARIRLDHLKSGCHSPSSTDGMLYKYNRKNDSWDSEDSREEDSALDSVELLEVEEGEQDEESWLYESPKKQELEERSESALRWCRHVLDNPSPEMEAACRSLINWLNQNHNELSISRDTIYSNCRLQDITDVHIMARIQEASLRQTYVSTPTRTRSPEPSPGLSSLSSSPRRSPTVAKQGCQSPKLARLHQQVIQFKLLKQNQATSPDRTRTPLRTSLRSLQAVRNSRSLDTEDCQFLDHITSTASGASSVSNVSGCWSPSLSSAAMISNSSLHAVRASERLLRSHSLSPSRIPHPAKGHLSDHGRIFASPDRSTSMAWGRNVPSTQW
ncbi:SLAIN motif-containing protein-like [Dissostichus eleginoides]|uniref:SLAIN motif-containing protein-like n=1 Tax=Dissostichus eleginoides TaxID=100907 RepID=A0AAD9BFJ1_DISEL|nr:SLAIN motif-containing protein-like [Dissostichus eleginoides]